MNICPKCGLPFEGDSEISLGEVRCDYCGWKGDKSERIYVDNDTFSRDDLAKVREVFVFLAKDISPRIMHKLIQAGFFKAETSELPKMIPLMANVTRKMFETLLEELCSMEPSDSEGDKHVGRTVHPET